MSNNTANVAVGKPKIGGAVYCAPVGTAIPTDATTNLATAFTCMGYCGDDGVTNANSPESDEIKAWGGDVVATPVTSRKDTFKFKLIEVANVDVLKAVYGSDNVSGALDTGVIVKANNSDRDEMVWVIDMILKGNAKRVVIPKGNITELGDITYKDDEVIGYEITLSALPDTSDNTHYEYLKASTTTE